MAKYNTFVVVDCKKRKNLLTTSSAKKANKLLRVGVKIEVWSENEVKEVIYCRPQNNKDPMRTYLLNEKEYIGKKQKQAEARNRRKAMKIKR